MSFNSVNFLVFFPVVVLIYYIIPIKTKYNIRSIWLLVTSYYFYMSWNPKYVVLILISTIITYICGILMDCGINNERISINETYYKRIILTLNLLSNIGILFLFKYGNWVFYNINVVLGKMNIVSTGRRIDFLLPVGISFYTFQAIGYTIDVYRGDIKAEKNLVQYALFVSFFPQLVAGPIERSGNLLKQLRDNHRFDLNVIREGLLMMLWGYFLKLVIADRVCLFVDCVYDNYTNYSGWYLIVACSLFGLQVYCDFYGYSMIAKGAARVLGYNLMDNFDAPFFATSVSEFWRKWHISLTSWFRDYLYIPMGGNRKGKIRQYINIISVFTLSGLWHGANWTYVVWGFLNGFYQVLGKLLMPVRNKIISVFQLDENSYGHKIARMLGTYILVDFTWLFFRAESLRDSVFILKKMFNISNIWVLIDHKSIFECGIDRYDFTLLFFAIFILLISDICKTKKISIMNDVLLIQNLWFRWIVYIISFVFVLVFGVWGSGYTDTAFLYFQF